MDHTNVNAIIVVSQIYLEIILCAILPPAGRRSRRTAISIQGLFEGPRGSLSPLSYMLRSAGDAGDDGIVNGISAFVF
jgi:hypothetical protein